MIRGTLFFFLLSLPIFNLYARPTHFIQFQFPIGRSKVSLERPKEPYNKKEIEGFYYGFGLAFNFSIIDNYFLRLGWSMKGVDNIKDDDQVKRDNGDNFAFRKSYRYIEGELGMLYFFHPNHYYVSLVYTMVRSTDIIRESESKVIYYGRGAQVTIGKLWGLTKDEEGRFDTELVYSYLPLHCSTLTDAVYEAFCQQTKGVRHELGLRLSLSFFTE